MTYVSTWRMCFLNAKTKLLFNFAPGRPVIAGTLHSADRQDLFSVNNISLVLSWCLLLPNCYTRRRHYWYCDDLILAGVAKKSDLEHCLVSFLKTQISICLFDHIKEYLGKIIVWQSLLVLVLNVVQIIFSSKCATLRKKLTKFFK